MLSHHKGIKREVYSVIYLWICFGGILRQPLKTDRRLSAGICEHCCLLDAGWRLFAGVYTVSYMRQFDGCLWGVCNIFVI
jgi:hypothetical protein